MLLPVFAAVVFTRILTAMAFSASALNNIAVYWGQNSGGGQQPLANYCAREEVDIVILSFLYGFPKMMLNFANACENTFTSEGLLHCSNIANDIKTCQQNGKKVLLSLGGATGVYGFTSDSEATEFADTLWNYFGAGNAGVERPFDDAIVDGFDFDIENQNQVGYPALANALRQKFAQDSLKQYYLAAAPQCPYPDASVGNVLAQLDLDFAFIQFYNNYCSLGPNFNWDTWTDFAANVAPNKNIKLYVGLPGEARSAGTGYLSAADVAAKLPLLVLLSPAFGGFSFWDASLSIANVDAQGQNMAQALKALANGASPAPQPQSSSSSSTTTTTTSTLSTINPWQPTTSSSTTSTTTTLSTTTTSTTSSLSTINPWQPTTTTSLTLTTAGPATTSSSSSVEAQEVTPLSPLSLSLPLLSLSDLLGGNKGVDVTLSSLSDVVPSPESVQELTTEATTEATAEPTTAPTAEPSVEPTSESNSPVAESTTSVVLPESIDVVDPSTAVPEQLSTVPPVPELTEASPAEPTDTDATTEEVYEPTTLQTSSIRVVDAFPTSSVVTTTETQADGLVVVVTRTEGHTVTQVVTEAALQTTRVKVMTVKKPTTAFNTRTTTAMTTRYITTLYRH